ncbi:peroxiredoxin family protein [Agriterribacter humi]|uniref:peroxiredoxin family protein n=1 Tax=Agriterribacter humi TaxID=1104781 RepID=UPI00186B1869|nr:TlpA disulfide reductase family protein [Agriterribacter humi]
MKLQLNYILLFAFTVIPFCSVGQYKFTIKGHIDNRDEHSSKRIASGDKMILRFYNLQRSDTALINNDAFVIRGEVPYPSIAMLEYRYGGSLILLDSSAYDYHLRLIKLEGAQRQYESEIKTNSPFFMTWKNFQENKTKLFEKKAVFTGQAENTKDTDSILYYKSNIKSLDDEIAQSYKQLAADNRNSYATAYIVPAAPDFSYDGYIDIYNSLPGSIKNTFYGKNFHNRLLAFQATKSTEGIKQVVDIPSITGIDTVANKVTIDKDFFKKNKYTLIEFWASWCGPCRTVNQELRQRRDELKKSNIELLGFSLDMYPEPWKRAVAKDNTGWPQLSDLKATGSPIVKFLEITAIPSNIIVDSSGKIIKRNIYGKELDEFIQDEPGAPL